MNAGVFEKYAIQKTNEIFDKCKVAVMVGGTGLYINAFCEGIDEIPSIDSKIRNIIIESYNQNGLLWLQEQVQKNDKEFWEISEKSNPQRLMRALEVKLFTGNSILKYQQNSKAIRNFNVLKIGLTANRQLLINRINERVDVMIREGLVEEVKGLQAYQNLNALQTVGYTEIFNYLNNESTLNEAIEKIKISTRQYAKRQVTWFKRDEKIEWFDIEDKNFYNDILKKIENCL